MHIPLSPLALMSPLLPTLLAALLVSLCWLMATQSIHTHVVSAALDRKPSIVSNSLHT